jgi:hypothetical protein
MEERLEFLERYTAFKRRDLDTHVNYRRKPGLLSTIDAEGRRMTTELDERVAATRSLEATPVSGDLGLAPQRASTPTPASPMPRGGATPTTGSGSTPRAPTRP